MTADTFLYFAYGSNMSLRRITVATRAPSAKLLGPASIAGHRLTFDKVGADGSGKADCERTGDLTDRVHGALFVADTADLAALDHAEGTTGTAPGYRRTEVVVWTEGGPKKAMTYLGITKRADLLPYPWYVNHVLVGARELGLPQDYLADLGRLQTQPDSDPARVARESALYE
jgi:gamma-glutamylcyclotransferase